MLDNSITIPYAGANYTLKRINQDNFGSVYKGKLSGMDTRLTIKHTFAPRGKAGTSHMIRLDREQVTDGVLERTDSAWIVIKTFDGPEATGFADKLGDTLAAFVTADSGDTTTFLSRVVENGES